jgi:hypothetical protein
MTTRERSLALGVVTAAVLGGMAFLYYKTFVAPLQDLDASMVTLQQDVENKEERVERINRAKGRLERWRQLSLPSQLDFSQREYEIYLSGLLQDSGFPPTRQIMPKTPEKSSQVIAGKGPIYLRLPFTIQAKATLASLVDMLERFYRTPLLHQVKRLSIGRPSTLGTQAQSGELDIHLTVEALIVAGAENRQELLPGVTKRLAALDILAALQGAPTGLGLAIWATGPTGPLGPRVLAQPPRQYATIAKKNIFLGAIERPEVQEVARFVHLTDVTHDSERPCEAFLYDRYNGSTTRLRAETGFDTFWVRDSEGETLVRGKVARLDGRELVFQVDDSYYSMHVGENLAQALKHRLTADQLKVLGLGAVAEKVSTEAKANGDN